MTPSLTLIERVAALGETVVLVRSRAGDFVYDTADIEIMARDVERAVAAGAAGVAVGGIRRDGTIDVAATREWVACAAGRPVTFHRAFDQVTDQAAGLETLVECGVARILTAAGPGSAWEGRAAMRALVEQAGPRITILAGGGVRAAHAAELAAETGITELHSSGRPDFEAEVAALVALRSRPG